MNQSLATTFFKSNNTASFLTAPLSFAFSVAQKRKINYQKIPLITVLALVDSIRLLPLLLLLQTVQRIDLPQRSLRLLCELQAKSLDTTTKMDLSEAVNTQQNQHKLQMNSVNKVVVLFEGYSYTDPEDASCMRANCTTTVIQTANNKNIIVDTRTAWDGVELAEELYAQLSLTPKDIDAIVCTHGHSDHIGCNYLFTEAKLHVVGTSISYHDKYKELNGQSPLQLLSDNDDVTVVPTPGHTLSCVSVIVRNSNLGAIVGICGDLFERMEDIDDANIWLSAGSEDSKTQRHQRLRLAELCDYIIPGHGPGFVITENMRIKLRNDMDHKQ